jgi:ferredoxin
VEARCCDQFGHCELGKLVAYLDSERTLARGAVTVLRDAAVEGRIRREPGLCIGCGRCVVVCETSPAAGRALAMVAGAVGAAQPAGAPNAGKATDGPGSHMAGLVARPKRYTLRASGCTFCGQCVMVCPAGALTAPGEEGAHWLTDRRAKSDLGTPIFPPETWQAVDLANLAAVPSEAGVFRIMDQEGRVLHIGGVADLRQGLAQAVAEPASSTAAYFRVELDPLYTQRESELLARYAQEHGHLPAGNDLVDDLYDDDL